MEPILTLDARDNTYLESVFDDSEMDTYDRHQGIQALHMAMLQILTAKGVNYSGLKSALVPQGDRQEIGFVFDSQRIQSAWYGYEVFKEMIPIFDRKSSHSVLCGDLIHNDQKYIFKLLQDHFFPIKSLELIDSSQLFCVYVNNLTDTMLERIHQTLFEFDSYIGFIPAKFSSKMKDYLSVTLSHSFLKSKSIIIMGHEDDGSNEEDFNVKGYPFEENDYKCISLQSLYFSLFLSYKIERAVYSGFENDTDFAINAVTDTIVPLEDLTILIEDAKLGYLHTKKEGTMKRAGFIDMDKLQLAKHIKSKIASNYIYNIAYSQEYDVTKFNIMIEVGESSNEIPARVTVALEYKPRDKALRVLTLF